MDSLEASTKSQDELSDNLDAWEENTKNVFKGNIQSELDAVLLDTIEKYPQSIQPYLDMIDGQRMDLSKFRYKDFDELKLYCCLLYTSPSPRDRTRSRMPSSA